MINKNELYNALNRLNIPKGKPVIIHTSLKAIGETEGGAEALLEMLITYAEENKNLICIPTHTWKTMVMDMNNPDSCLGVLPPLASKHPKGIRSMHPTHSITVFGDRKRAEEFVKNEKNVDTPTNPEGAYGNIIKEDGYVLLIGVNQTKNTIIHCVEEMLSVKNRLTKEKVEAKIIHKDGTVEKRYLHWFDDAASSDVSLNFGKFEAAFRHFNCIQDGLLGNAKTQLCSVTGIKKALEIIYKNAGDTELLSNDLPLDESFYKTN